MPHTAGVRDVFFVPHLIGSWIFRALLGGATSFPSPGCFPKAEIAWGWHYLPPQLPYFKPALHPTANAKWTPQSCRVLLPGSHCLVVFRGRWQGQGIWNDSLKISSLPVWPREQPSPAFQVLWWHDRPECIGSLDSIFSVRSWRQGLFSFIALCLVHQLRKSRSTRWMWPHPRSLGKGVARSVLNQMLKHSPTFFQLNHSTFELLLSLLGCASFG